MCAVDATRRVLEAGHRVDNVAALLEKIVDEVADTMDRMADKIGSELDAIEEQILRGRGEAGNAPRSRYVAANLRAVAPATGRAARAVSPARAEEHRQSSIPEIRLHAGKLAQRLDGLDHDIVELRERSRLLEEEIRFKMEEESNRHLHALAW